MKRLAPLSLLLLLAALYTPIASAALADPMPCCPGRSAAMMCCPLHDSCVWKSCHGDQQNLPPASLSVFALAAPSALALPSEASFPMAPLDALPQAGSRALPDPPPRA